MPDKANAIAVFDRIKAEHRAFAILCALMRSPGYTANNSVLLGWLRSIALVSTRDELNEAIKNLDRLGLIRTETVENLVVIELRECGQDVALGLEIVDGVLRPAPESTY